MKTGNNTNDNNQEYPELEGTVKLTDELILKREIYNWLSTRFTEDAPLNYIIREYRKKFLNDIS